MIIEEHGDDVTMVEVACYVESAAKITVNYTGGESYHVKEVSDIYLGYDKGGKFILLYSEGIIESYNTTYGVVAAEGVVTHAVTTGDIKSVTVQDDVDLFGIRRKTTFEVVQ